MKLIDKVKNTFKKVEKKYKRPDTREVIANAITQFRLIDRHFGSKYSEERWGLQKRINSKFGTQVIIATDDLVTEAHFPCEMGIKKDTEVTNGAIVVQYKNKKEVQLVYVRAVLDVDALFSKKKTASNVGSSICNYRIPRGVVSLFGFAEPKPITPEVDTMLRDVFTFIHKESAIIYNTLAKEKEDAELAKNKEDSSILEKLWGGRDGQPY